MNFLCQSARNYKNKILLFYPTCLNQQHPEFHKFRPSSHPLSAFGLNCIMKSVKLGILSRLINYAPPGGALTRFCDVSKRVVEQILIVERLGLLFNFIAHMLPRCSPNLIAASSDCRFWRLWWCFREHFAPFNELRVLSNWAACV